MKAKAKEAEEIERRVELGKLRLLREAALAVVESWPAGETLSGSQRWLVSALDSLAIDFPLGERITLNEASTHGRW